MYRITTPAPGNDPDWVDSIWGIVEPQVPASIIAATSRSESKVDHSVLVAHLACALVRHPDYEAAVNRWRGEAGMPSVVGDDVQIERVTSLMAAIPELIQLRWRFVHSANSSQRFLLNDRGWMYLSEAGRPGRALFAPLSSRLALLGWKDPVRPGQFDHGTLRPSWVRWINACTWADAPQFIVGHRDDTAMIRKLVPIPVAARRLHVTSAYEDHDGGLVGGGP